MKNGIFYYKVKKLSIFWKIKVKSSYLVVYKLEWRIF